MANYTGYGMPRLDFSSLANLPDIYRRSQNQATLADLGRLMQQGQVSPEQAASVAIGAGATGLGTTLLAQQEAKRQHAETQAFRREESARAQANAEEAKRQHAETQAFRREESARAQANADRAFAFQKQQAEEAARGYDIRQDPDSGTWFRIHKQTGTIEPLKIEGEGAGGPSMQPNNPYALGGKQTEAQSKDATYANRMFGAEAILRDPAAIAAGTDLTQQGLAKIPVAGNYAVSSDYQRYDQASRDFINATLRRESGAVISQSEFDNAYRQYLPRPGDSQQVLEQKRQNRIAAIKGIAGGAGRAYKPPMIFDEQGNLIPHPKNQRQVPKVDQQNAGKAIDAAKAAVAQGAPLSAVNERLRAMGLQPLSGP